MSSHHFVREGQEPALLILEPTSYSDAEGLLEWAPLVVVTESALREVLLWGIKIDVVIAHPENEAKLTALVADQAPVKIFSAGHDLVEASFLFLTGTGERAASVISQGITEMVREKIERFSGKIMVNVRTPGEKWSFISSGKFKKWYQTGSIVGFSNPTLGVMLKASKMADSRYELTEDQWITIENQPPFWITEQV